jgi:hypothetical protein
MVTKLAGIWSNGHEKSQNKYQSEAQLDAHPF